MKKETLEKYDRMIEWAEMQDPDGIKNHRDMLTAIGAMWFAEYCPYCKVYYNGIFCVKCPLILHKAGCAVPNTCCDNLWSIMNKQPTWGKWAKAARAVREYIRVYG